MRLIPTLKLLYKYRQMRIALKNTSNISIEYRQHIQKLQQLRHRLLRLREKPGAATIAIDMELNIVRTELHTLYAQMRMINHRET